MELPKKLMPGKGLYFVNAALFESRELSIWSSDTIRCSTSKITNSVLNAKVLLTSTFEQNVEKSED